MHRKSLGKKVFFINPHSVIEQKLVQDLVSREFEVYLVRDHRKIESICEHFTDPIIFINIDEGLTQAEWISLIADLMEKEHTKLAKLGVLTYNDSPDLSKKYLMDLSVPCGFIKLKQGLIESTEILLKTLEVNEVKGDRKFVRASCSPGEGLFNIQISDRIEKGRIIDISSVGMAVSFDSHVQLVKNSYISDVQLKLKGILVGVSAVVLGHRIVPGEAVRYLFIFDKRISTVSRSKIRAFINRSLQLEMERKLNFQPV